MRFLCLSRRSGKKTVRGNDGNSSRTREKICGKRKESEVDEEIAACMEVDTIMSSKKRILEVVVEQVAGPTVWALGDQ